MSARTLQKDLQKCAEITVGAAVVGVQSLVVAVFVVFNSL
jgi:hypothetical protein